MLKPRLALRLDRRLARLALPVLCACLAGGCSRAQPPPAPAPPQRLLAAVAASEAAALSASPDAEGGKAKPVAERLSGPLARLDPARIDPHLAERFLSR